MNQNLMWAERDRIKHLVDESPTVAVMFRRKLIPNRLGGMTTDPFGEPEEAIVRFRIAHDRKGPPEIGAVNGAFFTSDHNRIATWGWDTDIREGDAYTDEDIGKRFVFGQVDALRKFGGIVGFQAPLTEGEQIQIQPEHMVTMMTEEGRADLIRIYQKLVKPLNHRNIPADTRNAIWAILDALLDELTVGTIITEELAQKIDDDLNQVLGFDEITEATTYGSKIIAQIAEYKELIKNLPAVARFRRAMSDMEDSQNQGRPASELITGRIREPEPEPEIEELIEDSEDFQKLKLQLDWLKKYAIQRSDDADGLLLQARAILDEMIEKMAIGEAITDGLKREMLAQYDGVKALFAQSHEIGLFSDNFYNNSIILRLRRLAKAAGNVVDAPDFGGTK